MALRDAVVEAARMILGERTCEAAVLAVSHVVALQQQSASSLAGARTGPCLRVPVAKPASVAAPLADFQRWLVLVVG